MVRFGHEKEDGNDTSNGRMGAKMMIKGNTPRALDGQEAYAKAENLKEWIQRFAETGDSRDYDKLTAKYKELGKMIDNLEQWTTIV